MSRTIILYPGNRQYALRTLSEAPDGYVVTVAEPRKNREQEMFYWALCGEVAKQATFNGVKMDADSWMSLFMDALFKGEGRTVLPSLDGRRIVQRDRSTKKLKKHEASVLIELILAEGHHRGVTFKTIPPKGMDMEHVAPAHMKEAR